jgi:zinc transport system substrate-binding protein
VLHLLSRPAALALFAVLAMTAAACGGGQTASTAPEDGPGTPTNAATDDSADATPVDGDAGAGLTIVTTVFPLASLAEDIAPDADVTLLTSSGQDPHDLELSPSDRALIESADVVLYMGDIDFQPQVESAVAEATGEVVAVSEFAAASLRDFDDHSDDEGDDHSDDGAVDPHLWFDAAAMAEVAEGIGEALAAADAENGEAYRANAASLHDELVALDDEIDTMLAECNQDEVIVGHAAYAYLLEPRGLEQEGISGAGGHSDASPARLAELTERINDEAIPAVLAEPLEGRADAEALANESGAELLEINPLELGDEDMFARGYVQLLREQAEVFAQALECA